MNNMIDALEHIAAYPRSRSEEMSTGTAREIARAALASQAQQPSIEDQRAKLVVNMVKYLGATKTQAKAIVDGVFDGENTVKELFLFQDVPNTLAGFLGGCAGSGVTPTQQMIYDAGVKSGMNRIQSQAQQESSLIDLMAKHGICVEFSHDQMIVMAYWCGNPDRVFRQYNKGNLAEAIKTCVTTVASALPPAPEGDKTK